MAIFCPVRLTLATQSDNMRVSVIALASVSAGVIAAQKNNGNVEEMLIESWEAFGPTLAASLLASDTTATTYVLGCASNIGPTDCGFAAPIIATHGPSTMHYNRKLTNEEGPEYDLYVTHTVFIASGFVSRDDYMRLGTCLQSIFQRS